MTSSFRIALPATSANLGPAFDAAGLALDLYLELTAQPSAESSIAAQGRDAEICGRVEDHLILKTYRAALDRAGAPPRPLALTIDNAIPIGKGCGSSAAARLAGLALANRFGNLGWSNERIIEEGTRLEGHPDNIAACWLGGLVISRGGEGNTVQTLRLTPALNWPLLLAIPAAALATEAARAVLPAEYQRADAVKNIQNAMLLLAAFAQGRGELLRFAFEDRMHEPYRAQLCPLLPALKPLAGSEGILGVALSGAGPSVLLVLEATAKADAVRRRVADRLASQGLEAELLPTRAAAGVRLG